MGSALYVQWTQYSAQVYEFHGNRCPTVASNERMKGANAAKHDRSHVALIAQLVEHCTGNAKVVGSNPVQSLNFFSVHFSSSVMAAFAPIILSLLATVGHLLPWN